MPPSSTRTYTLFPYTTLFLSGLRGRRRAGLHALHGVGRGYAPDAVMSKSPRGAAWLAKPVSRLNPMRADRAHRPAGTVRPPPRCAPPRSAERRGGKAGVRTGRSRWSPYHIKKKKSKSIIV